MNSPLSFVSGLLSQGLSFASSNTLDLVVIAGIFFVLYWFSLRYGKGRIIALILSLYVGLLLFLHFPYSNWFALLGAGKASIMESLVFLGIVLASTFILGRMGGNDFSFMGLTRTLESLLLAGSATLLLLAFWYQVLPLSNIYAFGAPVASLFASPELFFWWLLAPLGAILLTSHR